jgi:hypothetical protein
MAYVSSERVAESFHRTVGVVCVISCRVLLNFVGVTVVIFHLPRKET